jgi:GNAT superfamily N-acetyltransferase
VKPVPSATTIVPVTTGLLTECLAFDDVAVSGDIERRNALRGAAEEGRMRVATLDDRAVGFSVMAPWFFGVPFLAHVYVDAALRRRGMGSRLLEDVEQSHNTQVFTSTNMSNAHAALADNPRLDAMRHARRVGRRRPRDLLPQGCLI